MNIHATEARSRANGPGIRFVVWFQGCSLGCPGCFNPDTHASAVGGDTALAGLMDQILASKHDVQGVTISGGEPFEQPQALLALVEQIRARTALSVLVFSGFTRTEIEALPLGPTVLANIDVLIDGRYIATERVGTGLRGSENQHIHLLTDRYTEAAVTATPEAEIRIDPTGRIYLTGVAPLVLKD